MYVVRSKAPMRISFAGGGTDVDPFPERSGGGAVLNCTIDKYAFATLKVDPRGKLGTSVTSVDYDMSAHYGSPEDLKFDGKLDLVKASLRVLRPLPSPGKEASESLDLLLHSDAPIGTGLGSSSAMAVALVGVFRHYLREAWTPYEIAELAYQIERGELGFKGGRQDQYAATFGGFNFMEFSGGRTIVAPLKIHPEVVNELAYRLILCYTGTKRFSGGVIERQQAGLREGRTETVEALEGTRELAVSMKNELLRGDIDEVGRLLDEGWQLKKRFAEGITNPQIDSFYDRARAAGAIGGKLTGAGGGGHLLLFCDVERRTGLVREIRKMGGEVVDFSFEPEGLQTWTVRAAPVAGVRANAA